MKTFLPLLLALILSSCVISQRTLFLAPPPTGRVDSIDVADYEKRFGKYDGIYLESEKLIEHSGVTGGLMNGVDSWGYSTIARQKVLVLNPNAERLTTFRLTLGKRTEISALYLQMTHPGGAPIRYGVKDLIKQSPSPKTVEYTFIYPNVVKGTIIEEGIDLTYQGAASASSLYEDIPLQYSLPCEKLTFTYAFPDWWTVRVKKIGMNDTIPYSVDIDSVLHKRTLRYAARNVPPILDEPYSPFFKEMARYFQLMVTSLRMGSFEYSAPQNWSNLVKRSEGRLTDREGRGLFSSRVQKTTEELTNAKASQLEKLVAIVEYVQANIEFVYEIKVRDFADVLKDKKGDAFEITGLTNMMLQKAGLQSNFLMVHSAVEGYFDPQFYSYEQFGTPAVGVFVEGKEYVILPYYKDIPYDHIPDYLLGQTAIVVSKSPTGNLTMIPESAGTKDRVDESFNLLIGEDGIVTVEETKTIQGSYAHSLRRELAEMKPAGRDQFLKDLISYSEGQVKILSYDVISEKEYRKPLVLRYTYTIDNLVTLASDEVLFHTAGLFAPASLKRFRVEAENRANPIKIFYDEEYVKSITLRYPTHWVLKSPPQPLALQSAFGSLKREIELAGNTLAVKQSRVLKRGVAPKEKARELSELTGSTSSIVLPTLMFSRKP
jgi:hypothetical protein